MKNLLNVLYPCVSKQKKSKHKETTDGQKQEHTARRTNDVRKNMTAFVILRGFEQKQQIQMHLP